MSDPALRKQVMHMPENNNKDKKTTSEKPISLSPLKFKEALEALVKVKPEKEKKEQEKKPVEKC